MTFSTVVSGSALNPDAAPEMMKSVLKSMNDATVAQLLEAINACALAKAWNVKGGYLNWFYSVIKGVAEIFARLFNIKFNYNADGLMEYFKSVGYNNDEAGEIAKNISNEMSSY